MTCNLEYILLLSALCQYNLQIMAISFVPLLKLIDRAFLKMNLAMSLASNLTDILVGAITKAEFFFNTGQWFSNITWKSLSISFAVLKTKSDQKYPLTKTLAFIQVVHVNVFITIRDVFYFITSLDNLYSPSCCFLEVLLAWIYTGFL